MEMRLNRSSDVRKKLLDEEYCEIKCYERKSKLPPGRVVLGRMLFLCTPRRGKPRITKLEASLIVANELIDNWVDKNVYPSEERTVSRKILRDYDEFIRLRKAGGRSRPTPKDWEEDVDEFNENMTKNAYNIRANPAYQQKLETEYQLKMTERDESFWKDNCFGKYVFICTRTVDAAWKKWYKRRCERALAEQRKQDKAAADVDSENIQHDPSDESSFESDDNTKGDGDVPFVTVKKGSAPPETRPVTRSSGTIEDHSGHKTASAFPSVEVRSGYRSVNEPIMRSISQCLADYKVSTNDLLGIVMQVANTIFGQSWAVASEAVETEETDDEDSDAQDTSQKRKLKARDLTYVLPSRKTMSRYVEDASFLNLKVSAHYWKQFVYIDA